MTIAIPKGTILTTATGNTMRVGDESTAEVIALDVAAEMITVKFEDGEEYTVSGYQLAGGGRIYINPGNNVTSRNGVKCQGSISGRSS